MNSAAFIAYGVGGVDLLYFLRNPHIIRRIPKDGREFPVLAREAFKLSRVRLSMKAVASYDARGGRSDLAKRSPCRIGLAAIDDCQIGVLAPGDQLDGGVNVEVWGGIRACFRRCGHDVTVHWALPF
jgi:hypothetical protein